MNAHSPRQLLVAICVAAASFCIGRVAAAAEPTRADHGPQAAPSGP